MKTRSQSRREQTSQTVASLGVNSPGRCRRPLQGNADVANAVNGLGGSQADAACGDGSTDSTGQFDPDLEEHVPKICQRTRCGTCFQFEQEVEFSSTITKRKYKTINNRNCPLDCCTDNLVYMIECQNCHVQYVGETSQMLSGRFSDHRSRIGNHNPTKKDTILIDHFNNGMCKGQGFTTRIIETMEIPAKVNGDLDASATTIRRKREENWMEELHTIYPFGLNNRHGDNQDQRNEHESVSSAFHTKRRNKRRRFRPNKQAAIILADQVFEDIIKPFQNNEGSPEEVSNAIAYAKKMIPQMRKSEVKKLGRIALEEITKDNDIPQRILHVAIDLTTFKLQFKTKQQQQKLKRKIEYPFKIQYVNHWIEKLNIGHILKEEELMSTLPSCIREKSPPTIVYKYKPTIRGKLFNYKKTVAEFQHEEDIHLRNCSCDSSQYRDEDHGHVVTGNLMIIENKTLRELFRKGPNYREHETLNWSNAIKSLQEDLNAFVKQWSSRVRKPEQYFTEWKLKFIELVQLKYSTLKKKVVCRPAKQVLKTQACIEELDRLKELYVLVPIDKAANNIGFICKKYFLQILQQETQSTTYLPCTDTVEEIVGQIAEESRQTGIPVVAENKDLPQIHATIKMHKNPVKFRFIIGAKQCVLKQVAKRLVKVLQLIMKVHRRYCDKIKFYTGIERYWIIDSNVQVLEDIKTINSRKSARNIRTYDFSTLYTKIPLDDLKEKLKIIIEKAFKGGQNKYIRITKDSSRWYHSKGNNTVTKEEVFNMIDLIIDNSFFKFGNKVYRQCIGIPMGIDPAPQMANLYLYSYEAKFMETLTKENYGVAKKFNYTRRYIDDLNTLNNDGHMEEYHKNGRIYPTEMQLNQENDNDDKATFLDLEEMITEKEIIVKTFDKRDAFDFEIVNYPDLSGNIPKKPAYGVYSSQIIRYARTCSNAKDLIERVKELTRKLKKKNYTIEGLKNSIKECLKKNRWILRKLEQTPYRKLLTE